MLLQCAKCGRDLTREEAREAVENNLPPTCAAHATEVYEEIERDHSMWPSNWHGHASTNPDGKWHELPSDDGDYDVFQALMEDDEQP